MFSTAADLFFKDPLAPPGNPPVVHGVLYLLRRDIRACLGVDNPRCRTLWPGAMGILAGVDLLAKFYAGDDSVGSVGERFRDFVKEFFKPLSGGGEDVIYQLRNALLHSFGLYSKKGARTYRFVLTDEGGRRLILQKKTDEYSIDLLALHRRFELAVKRYGVRVDKDPKLQKHFGNLFPNYGSVKVWG